MVKPEKCTCSSASQIPLPEKKFYQTIKIENDNLLRVDEIKKCKDATCRKEERLQTTESISLVLTEQEAKTKLPN